jgi:hypothetical protein
MISSDVELESIVTIGVEEHAEIYLPTRFTDSTPYSNGPLKLAPDPSNSQ